MIRGILRGIMPKILFTKGGKRPPNSGRQKGVPTKAKIEFETASQVLEKIGLNPIERQARMADGDVPCGVCFGKGKTKFQPKRRKPKPGTDPLAFDFEDVDQHESLSERTCQSCYGSGREQISPELRQRCLSDLAKYVYPTLKQIEHTGPAGEPLPPIRVEWVK